VKPLVIGSASHFIISFFSVVIFKNPFHSFYTDSSSKNGWRAGEAKEWRSYSLAGVLVVK